jgi:signal transduction histidine kinase
MTMKDTTIRALLVAEDEDVFLVRELLSASRQARYELDQVSTYEEGMVRLRRNEHDVCLMDYHLGGTSAALAVLQARERIGSRVPIIILTSQDDLETDLEVLEAGAADYLDKGELTANILERSTSILERSIRHAMAQRKGEDALRRSQERLIEAELRKDELLAMLAHELRNPLAPIRYALQSLRLDAPQNVNLQRQRELIERQVRQMARLLDDLLDVSRMTRGKIHLQKEKLDLGAVADRAVEAARLLIREHRLELVYNKPADPLWVEGDFGRLEQILRNLLYNAVKFTKAGGRVWLSVEPENGAVQGQSPMAIVRVVDTGIGIDSEMLPRVFDLFTQLDQSLNRAQGGLGIGLTMVKHLVRMHGGTVRAQSKGPDQGSEFEIHLPLLAHPEQRVTKPQPSRREGQARVETPALPGRPRRVLVVEDNLDSANALGELIELWGHEACVVNDGPAAIEAATTFQPDVVLLDIGLPGMNGYQVARYMRSRPALKEAMLVALTGYGQEEDRRLAELSGFDQHFTKPIELETLQSLLKPAA